MELPSGARGLPSQDAEVSVELLRRNHPEVLSRWVLIGITAAFVGYGISALTVYLKVKRSAVITVTYDTVHEVTFTTASDTLATSRSIATHIAEADGSDRGFLWKLNSYWQYRQVGDAVQIDVLSLSLSRDVPALARPIAAPLISRISRESMRRTLDAMDRFAVELRAPRTVPAGAH